MAHIYQWFKHYTAADVFETASKVMSFGTYAYGMYMIVSHNIWGFFVAIVGLLLMGVVVLYLELERIKSQKQRQK